MPGFDVDRESVIERATAVGVARMLVPAVNQAAAANIVALAAHHPPLFAAVGVHPTEARDLPSGWLADLRRLASQPKVIAIGEIGLDYYWVREPEARARQREMLSAQLELASELGLPVILHLREERDADSGACADDILAIVEAWVGELRSRQSSLAGRTGVMHSFSGSLETASRAIELGFFIGVTGPITFRNGATRRQIVSHLPLEHLLIETDSPYLAPEPHRGHRNEPAFVAHIADKIAEVQSRTPREVAEVTSANAARLFAWGETV